MAFYSLHLAMQTDRYDALISRLEKTAHFAPTRYLWAAIGITLLGFIILGLAIGLTVVAAASIVLLVIAVFATGGKALIFIAKLGKLVVLLALPAWAMVRAAVTLLFARFPKPEGRPLTPAEAPRLFEHLADLRRRTGGPCIHVVLLTDELNAAIVQHPRLGLFGWERNYLILGLRLLQTLSEPQALAVVAHEYGHLAGCHGRLGGFIYRFRCTWGRLQQMSEQWNDWGSRLIARLFRWYAPYFNAYTFVLARQNEYAADRFAADIAGHTDSAAALIRVNIASRVEQEEFWPAIEREISDHPQPIGDRSARWKRLSQGEVAADREAAYLAQAMLRTTDHHDTHPALKDRLSALGMTHLPTPTAPAETAAILWLGSELEAIGQALDKAWRTAVAPQWEARHAHLKTCRTRLAEIDALTEWDADTQWERIQVKQELGDTASLLSDAEQLLTTHPEHLSARYLRGRLRLKEKDPGGVDDLEAVMRSDPTATLPACELLWLYFHDNDPERAAHYKQRWQERADLENRINTERATLPGKVDLAAPDLDDAVTEAIRAMVTEHAKYIRIAYLLRRPLASDPAQSDYVLAFETRRFTLGDKSQSVVQTLLQCAFPTPLFIVHLGTPTYRGFRKQIKRLGLTPIFRS